MSAFCPICKDWIIQPGESLNGHKIEDLVVSHYEDFHTIEEIERFKNGKEKVFFLS